MSDSLCKLAVPYIVQPRESLDICAACALCEVVNLVTIAKIAQRFGVKLTQARISEHVVRSHSTLHSSTSALGVVCATCVILGAGNLC